MSEARSAQNWIFRLLREHPALLISILYVVASIIGMMFAWGYLRHFGINIFNHAQIGDFLLASLKEPVTWGLVAFAATLVAFDNVVSQRWHRRARSRWTRWYGSPRYRSLNYLVAILIVVVFIMGFARIKAKKTMAGEEQTVQVQVVDEPAPRTATLLGTTSQFIFLYEAGSGRVDILPNESVRLITLYPPR